MLGCVASPGGVSMCCKTRANGTKSRGKIIRLRCTSSVL